MFDRSYGPFRFWSFIGLFLLSTTAACAAFSQESTPNVPGDEISWKAGVAKVDITPQEPVRMSGYGNRDHPSEGVDLPLSVRCVALLHRDDWGKSNTAADDAKPGQAAHLLISVETIGLSGAIAKEISERILTQHGVARERLVLASTHTHCAPSLVSELTNIFAVPLTEAEVEAGLRYRKQVIDAIVEAAGNAIADLKPAHLSHAIGKATFAGNRRVLQNGRWSGFGLQPDGPVDHSVPMLRVTSPEGKLRGVVYNYACHGTTLGGRHYRINGDWSGFASETLESRNPGVVALSTIGCGADANPQPHGTIEDAANHGNAMADEVERCVKGEMRPITGKIASKFDHAALSFELPTIEEVRKDIESTTPQISRHAKNMDEIYRQEGRLPATYPVPIQAWRFGSDLTMLFIGGEVVVDYAIRLKRELKDESLWITAYTNDVLGYIASERMRQEGGYEFDRSGVYYSLPGPWVSGTEDNLINQIHTLLKTETPKSPLSTNDALKSMRLSSDDYRIELVAAEPLVQDPISLAFGADGKLWVVEMGDYPGDESESDTANGGGGRVKFLEDTTGDGHYDRATVFMDGINFPTGVFPWRDGVLVSAAPDIVFARDTDGDGSADDIQKLYSGFALANPQHRINGFTYGLDHSLHCASGDNLGKITSVKTGEVVNASGHDVQLWPDDGKIAVTSGRTQFIRSRDDWGQWFGNDNSHPMFHFPIDVAYLKRNPSVTYDGVSQQMFNPPVAPPVFPVTSAAVRFNDLYAANRFTSACSSIVSRSPHFNVDGQTAAFVCEPVHNLVHRAILTNDGASYRASRSSLEQEREFLSSTDPWFRPVRSEIGPDGALWVVDMYRETIEHPEWIPKSWQAQLDFKAGSDRGRIYRIVPKIMTSSPAHESVISLESIDLVKLLDSPVGTLRDTASRLLVERLRTTQTVSDQAATIQRLKTLASQSKSPQSHVHALSILEVIGELDNNLIISAFDDEEPGVVLVAIGLAESRLQHSAELLERLAPLSKHQDLRVILALSLAMGQTKSPVAADVLTDIASRKDIDRWIRMAILSSSSHHAKDLLARLFDEHVEALTPGSAERLSLVSGLLDTAIAGGQSVTETLRKALGRIATQESPSDMRLGLAVSIARSFNREGVESSEILPLLQPIYQQALVVITDETQSESQRILSLDLIGKGIGNAEDERELIRGLLSPAMPIGIQRRAVALLADIDQDGFVNFVFDKWQSLTTSLRGDCVSRMLTRRPWMEGLLASLESGTIGVNELSASARQQLLHSGTRSMMVRAQRLIEKPGSSIAKRELITQYLSQFDSANQSAILEHATELGASLYTKHCAACHTPDEQGKLIGPSLSNLSDRSDRRLVEAILAPNDSCEPNYQTYILRTVDDEILVGTIETEVGETVTLGRADGTRLLVDRRRIAEMKNSGVSLMPEGFETLLRPGELRAVVRHLQQKPKDVL